MIATFVPEPPDRGASILQRAEGHALTVSLPTGNRVVLIVSDKDREKAMSQRGCVVTDLMTGQEHHLVPADCGSGCRCAIAFAGVR